MTKILLFNYYRMRIAKTEVSSQDKYCGSSSVEKFKKLFLLKKKHSFALNIKFPQFADGAVGKKSSKVTLSKRFES